MKTTNIILSEAFTSNFICAVILGGMKCLLVSIFLFSDFRSNRVQPLSSSSETLDFVLSESTGAAHSCAHSTDVQWNNVERMQLKVNDPLFLTPMQTERDVVVTIMKSFQ